MHRARVEPGWQYYQSGRYRSFLSLCFQSMMSSPGNHAVTQSRVSPGENPLVNFRDQKSSPMDFQDNRPDYAAAARCNPLVVHLLNNLWCTIKKTVDCNRDPGA